MGPGMFDGVAETLTFLFGALVYVALWGWFRWSFETGTIVALVMWIAGSWWVRRQ
jgi:hypothetical protein